MANDISPFVVPIIAKTLKKLRPNAGAIPLVTRDYENEFKEKGEKVVITIGSPKTVSDITPAMAFPTPADGTMSKVEMTLTKWRGTSANIKDDEIAKFDPDKDFIPSEIEECISPIIDEVHADLTALYKGIYGVVGAAATTPFATTIDALADAHVKLTEQKCPSGPRAALLNLKASGNLLKLTQLQKVNEAGNPSQLREAQLGRLMRFDLSDHQTMPRHTATNLSAGACTVNGVQAAGVGSTDGNQTGTLSIAKATNTSALVAGDIIEFTVGGEVQQHTVVTGVTLIVGNTSVTVAPALRVATAGGETITLRATHDVNLAMHKNAMALVVRPLRGYTQNGGQVVFQQMIIDPLTGVGVRVQIVRGFHMTAWYFDALWGVKLIRPQLACRILG